jgi:uncharacterized protein YbgA (DUF1722 family)/uncharacterized protein YbbK (DUF523 family)
MNDRTTAMEVGEIRWPRPRLVVSACLGFEACRYNGQTIRAPFLARLEPYADLVPVCPEVEIGLGVPRPAIRLVSIAGVGRLLQPATGRDVTGEMWGFATEFLRDVGDVDGYLLKGRSPSCGPRGVKVHAETGGPGHEKGPGVFAAAAAAHDPEAPLEDEGRLTNYRLRHHFLTRVFAFARLRALPDRVSELVAFHTMNKLLLLAHSEVGLRRLGRLVSNGDGLPAAELKRRYRESFAGALADPPRVSALVNAALHAFGHVSPRLTLPERRLFLESLAAVRFGQASLETPWALLRGWTARFEVDWLARQTLFRPYPLELHDLSDSAGQSRVA